MNPIRTRAAGLAFAALVSALVPASAAAQARAQTPPADRRAAPAADARAAEALVQLADDRDARETRESFKDLLAKYPPSLGRVLKLDPSLLESGDYLSAYPTLAAFLAQHPEVAHHPEFFLDHVYMGSDWVPQDAHSQTIVMWRSMMDGLGAFMIFVVFVVTFGWLTRTFIDYRRWSRLSKVQADVHNKLLDRFASNDDLLTYIQTTPGSRFLESAPIPLDSEPRSLGAPFGRILWSVQAGTVLGAAGLGLQFASGRVPEEITQPVFVMGALALALGLGFLVSAVISFVLSHRLGLLTREGAPALKGSPALNGPASGGMER